MKRLASSLLCLPSLGRDHVPGAAMRFPRSRVLGLITLSSLLARPVLADELSPVPTPAEPKPPSESNPPSAETRREATIHVRATKPGVVISRVTERMFAASAFGSAAGIAWKPVCLAPCEFKLEPGYHELMLGGEGHSPTIQQFQIAANDTYLVADPTSIWLRRGGYLVTTLGLVAATVGLTFYLVPETNYDTGESSHRGWEVPLMVGGLAGTGLGIGMMAFSGSSLTEEPAPNRQPVRTAVSYRSSW